MADDAQTQMPSFADIRPRRADNAPATEDSVASLGSIAADPECAPPRSPSTRASDAATTFAAMSAHGLVLLALLSATPTLLGSGGTSLDAISVSIVPATALESREAVPTVVPGAAAGFVTPTEGDDVTRAEASPDKKPEPKPPEPEREQAPDMPSETAAAPPTPAPVVVPDEAPVAVDKTTEPAEDRVALAEPPPRPPEEIKEPEVDRTTEPVDKKPEETAETPSPDARQAGGQTARGVAPELPPASAAASAAAGDVHAYGLAVQEALLAVDQSEVRTRKIISRTSGTAVVRFAVRPDGVLESADIAFSSGRRELDDAAVALVRLTTFPRPPPGLSSAQRTYVAPIVFRP